MKTKLQSSKIASTFTSEVIERSKQNVFECYQCGKCSAGCPVTQDMDVMPNQVIRYVQLGMEDMALSCKTIWMCVSCETCATRCPREVELPEVMDTLRAMSIARETETEFEVVPFLKDSLQRVFKGIRVALAMDAENDSKVFIKTFLETVRRHGRAYEAGLISGFNLNAGYLVRKMLKGPIMLIKQKIQFLPKKLKNAKKVKEIFDAVEDLEKTRL